MTGINQPAAIDNQAVAEPQTVEQLNESIAKLTANRDLILVEKRAATDARNELEEQLNSIKEGNASINSKYESLLIEVATDKLLLGAKVLPTSYDFVKYHLADRIKITENDGDKSATYTDLEGNSLTLEDMITAINDDKSLWSHIAGVDSSGGLDTHSRPSSGGNSFTQNARPKQISNLGFK